MCRAALKWEEGRPRIFLTAPHSRDRPPLFNVKVAWDKMEKVPIWEPRSRNLGTGGVFKLLPIGAISRAVAFRFQPPFFQKLNSAAC